MRRCKHFGGTMRLHHLGSIPSVLLWMTVFSAAVLGPLSANAADVQIDGADGPVTAQATLDQSPPKGGATTGSKKHTAKAGDTESPLEEIVVTGTYIRGVAPSSPVITITSADIENS